MPDTQTLITWGVRAVFVATAIFAAWTINRDVRVLLSYLRHKNEKGLNHDES